MHRDCPSLLMEIAKESLSWLIFLAIGSWAIFRDDLLTLGVTILVGLPGVFMLVSGKEIFELRNEEKEDCSGEGSSTACTWKVVLVALTYNAFAVLVLFAIARFDLSLGGVFLFAALELLLLSIVLLSESLLTKSWPPPSVLFLCDCLGSKKSFSWFSRRQ